MAAYDSENNCMFMSYLHKEFHIFLSHIRTISQKVSFRMNCQLLQLYLKVLLQGSKYHCPKDNVRYVGKQKYALLGFGVRLLFM